MDFKSVRRKCILETKKNIRDSVNYDYLLIQAVSSVEEIEKILNKVVTRLREWYSLYNPEFSRSVGNNEKFVELIMSKDKKNLLKEAGVKDTMGADLEKKDLDAIMLLANEAKRLVEIKEKEKNYIEDVLKKYCPNASEILGASLCGKLIKHAGSLKKLAMTPATVIQIMGAEKALFKHMKNKGKCPKYGLIYAHPMIGKVKNKNKGKISRFIADKAAMGFKIDYFKGKFIGDKLRKKVEERAALLCYT